MSHEKRSTPTSKKSSQRLEMEDIADAIIGEPESQLVIEQRKRVIIGMELSAKPEMLLFWVEPTSGLESQSAFDIPRFVKKPAAAGQYIPCTDLQSSSALFENFDRLLLTQREGEYLYFGDLGRDVVVLLEYLCRNASGIESRDWGDIQLTFSELADTKENIRRVKAERIVKVGSDHKTNENEFATPLWHQIKIVNRRIHPSFWPSPNYGFTRFSNHVAIAILTGLTFFQLDDSRSLLPERIFVIFETIVLPAIIVAQVEPKDDLSRLMFYRESAAKANKQLHFALSVVFAEIP